MNPPSIRVVAYGSHVYGTAHAGSDLDLFKIGGSAEENGTVLEELNVTTHRYSRTGFQALLDAHEISALEVKFHGGLDEYEFNLDKSLLRSSLSAKASNSFVKAKKKIEVAKEFYIGKKSLFHSLRILTFGIEIAKVGRIDSFSAANHYYAEIMSMPDEPDWSPYKIRFQPVYNELCTEFRKVAPK